MTADEQAQEQAPHRHAHRRDGHGHGPTWQEPTNPDPAVMWDERYAEGAWSTDPDAQLCALVAPLDPGTALDLGAGNGRNAVWLAEQGWEVTCVDASSVGLDQAARWAEASGRSLTCEMADLRTWEPAGRTFDLVVLANIHLPTDERVRLFALAQQAVGTRGRLFVIGHHMDAFGPGEHPHPERLFTEESLSGLIDSLDIDELRTVAHKGDHGHDSVDIVGWAHRTTP